MTSATSKYADFENLREQAIALRREGLSRRQIRDRLHVDNNDLLNRLLEGEPPPEWTRRPNAKDDLRTRARELRLEGWTYDRIQVELGCSKSSISLWVRDLPKPERKRTPEEASAIARRGWEATLRRREEERETTKRTAAEEIGALSERELFLLGVGLYWAEGSKDKPYDRRERVVFVNSDPGMIRVFTAWLDLLGVEPERSEVLRDDPRDRRRGRGRAVLGRPRRRRPSAFNKTTVKRHNPRTNRKNVDVGYHGCLVIQILRSVDLYRRIEGAWCGIVGAVPVPSTGNRT